MLSGHFINVLDFSVQSLDCSGSIPATALLPLLCFPALLHSSVAQPRPAAPEDARESDIAVQLAEVLGHRAAQDQQVQAYYLYILHTTLRYTYYTNGTTKDT